MGQNFEDSVTLFVKNLSFKATEDDLREAFPNAEEVRMPLRPSGDSKGFAFLQFATEDDVRELVENNQGMEVGGRELTLDYVGDRSSNQPRRGGFRRGPIERDDDDITMFVKNLDYDTTEDDIRDLFPNAQEIRMPSKPDGTFKGFAFVQFNNPDEVADCINKHQGVDLLGRDLLLDFVGSKSQNSPPRGGGRGGARSLQGRRDFGRGGGGGGGGRSQGRKTKVLFVKNLAYSATEETLLEAFEGAVDARIPTYSDTGRSKGFGYVEFDNAETAQQALEDMDGQEVEGRPVQVDYAEELRRDGGAAGGSSRGGGGGGGRGGRGRGRGFGRGGRGDRGGDR